MKYAFISGPYTQGDPVQNTRNAVLVGDELVAMGWSVFIPHLSLFWDMLRPHDYQFWLDHDIAWLLKCDALVRIPGESAGADAEESIARANGLLVCHWPKDMQLIRTLATWVPMDDELVPMPDD
jgi:Domain of unknown function (DUF4406)